jgi:uncharacterized membrane protein
VNGTLAHVRERLRTGYWLIPGAMVASSIGLAELMLWADEVRPQTLVSMTSWISVPRPEGSRAVLTAIATSMVTVAATVFSITMLTLSMASQQFGPRILRSFMRDRWNQVTLGVFTGTFMYALLVLRTAGRVYGEEFVPHLSVSVGMLLAMIAVGVLVLFIHHVSRSIQAPVLIAAVARELDDHIEAFYPDQLGEEAEEPPAVAVPVGDEGRVALFTGAGYVDAVKPAALAAAHRHNLVVELLTRPGRFVLPGEPAARAWPRERASDEALGEIAGSIILAEHRTPAQDPEFIVAQLAEIAVRALSPGVNDPFTAVNCVDHLAAGLVKLAGRRLPATVRTDPDSREPRLITGGPDFGELLRTGLGPIREYGSAHTMVVRRIAHALRRLSVAVRRPADRAALDVEFDRLRRSAREACTASCWPEVELDLREDLGRSLTGHGSRL